MELDTRLGILKDAGQIDDEVYKNVIKAISILHKSWGIELKEENGAMLITHLCIALQRIKDKCPVEEIDEELYKDIKIDKYFKTCEKAFIDIKSEINMDIPESEKSFLMMHLCVLFDKENIENLRGN